MEDGYQGVPGCEFMAHQKKLSLEKSRGVDKDNNIDRMHKEKTVVGKSLGTKQTAKERLVPQVHTLKNIDPMEKLRYNQMRLNICQQEH